MPNPRVKALKRIAIAAVALYMALLAGLWGVMHRPILFGQVMKHVPDAAFLVIPFRRLWFSARAGNLKVGDPAPDFNLSAPDKKASFRLSSLRGSKPAVLIFGSYT
jgi:hypothetical protein